VELGVVVPAHRGSRPSARHVPAARRSSLPDGRLRLLPQTVPRPPLLLEERDRLRAVPALGAREVPVGGANHLIQDYLSTRTTSAAGAEARKIHVPHRLVDAVLVNSSNRSLTKGFRDGWTVPRRSPVLGFDYVVIRIRSFHNCRTYRDAVNRPSLCRSFRLLRCGRYFASSRTFSNPGSLGLKKSGPSCNTQTVDLRRREELEGSSPNARTLRLSSSVFFSIWVTKRARSSTILRSVPLATAESIQRPSVGVFRTRRIWLWSQPKRAAKSSRSTTRGSLSE